MSKEEFAERMDKISVKRERESIIQNVVYFELISVLVPLLFPLLLGIYLLDAGLWYLWSVSIAVSVSVLLYLVFRAIDTRRKRVYKDAKVLILTLRLAKGRHISDFLPIQRVSPSGEHTLVDVLDVFPYFRRMRITNRDIGKFHSGIVYSEQVVLVGKVLMSLPAFPIDVKLVDVESDWELGLVPVVEVLADDSVFDK